jgi:hypothetical protein
MSNIKKMMPHLCIILAGMFIVFFVIDRFNSFMAVLDNDTEKTILFIFSIIAIIVSGMLIYRQRRED